MKRIITHAKLGQCFITDESEFLQKTNGDPSSFFIEHDGEMKEVSKHLLDFSGYNASKKKALFPVKPCKNCEGTNLSWHCSVNNNGGVQDGRIRMHEVGVQFVLGCDDCFETLKLVDGDKIAEFLTSIQKF